MNTLLKPGSEIFLARYEGLRGRLPGDAAARERAADIFREHGLPDVHQEAWKYTSLRPVAEAPFQEPLSDVSDRSTQHEQALLQRLPDIAMPRLLFIDGRFRPELSTLPEHATVGSFADTTVFGAAARPDRDWLVALNTMLSEDGATIDVAAGVDAGNILLAGLAADLPRRRPVAFHPRHRIRLAPGARLTLLEVATGEGSYLHNPVMEISVAAGAVLTHVRLQDESLTAFHLSTIYADIGAGASYDSFLLTLGSRLARCEVHARLHGEHGTVHLNGAQLLCGVQHADFTTVVSHDAPHCASRQTVKNVLAGKSRGVFQGKIEVARAAQKTDGYQMNQALLLSPEAEIDCKPQLEIYADDVKCSHGATVGELDAQQLFYLRSRGVSESEARAILVRAFLAEALDPIADDAIRDVLEAGVEAWWARQGD